MVVTGSACKEKEQLLHQSEFLSLEALFVWWTPEFSAFVFILLIKTSQKAVRKRQSNSITGLDRPLGFQEVEATRISRQSAHEGGKDVSTKHRPPFTPRGNIPPTQICYRLCRKAVSTVKKFIYVCLFITRCRIKLSTMLLNCRHSCSYSEYPCLGHVGA
jgi:hypothetical protein